jgi:hypothetical protein
MREMEVLRARNSSTTMIPVDVAVEVIDLAPSDLAIIMEIAQDASRAVDERDFPTARLLLHSLMSQIRVRTANLTSGHISGRVERGRGFAQPEEKQGSQCGTVDRIEYAGGD